jgi:hypothetical protein
LRRILNTTTKSKKEKEMTTDRTFGEGGEAFRLDPTTPSGSGRPKSGPGRRKGPAVTSKMVCSGIAATITFGVAGFLGLTNRPATADETDSAAGLDAITEEPTGLNSSTEQTASPIVVVVHRRIHVVNSAIPKPEPVAVVGAIEPSVGEKRASTKRLFAPKPAVRPAAPRKRASTARSVAKPRVAVKRKAAPTPVRRVVRRAKTKAS